MAVGRKAARPLAPPKTSPEFDVDAFLATAGAARTVVEFPLGAVIFSQGEGADDVGYVQKGTIKLSILSNAGKEAVVAILEPGDFFGKGSSGARPSGWSRRRP